MKKSKYPLAFVILQIMQCVVEAASCAVFLGILGKKVYKEVGGVFLQIMR